MTSACNYHLFSINFELQSTFDIGNRMFENLKSYYHAAKQNIWFHYFAMCCRVALAMGFIPSGIVKIMGERFASGLPTTHPLGHYLEALHLTGFYYTFIGVTQLLIAVLLLIPRTALVGALLYFPIILNICILTYATRFEGTRITTFMVLANLFLLCWDYERLKHLLAPRQRDEIPFFPTKRVLSRKFPLPFFAFVFSILALTVIINHFLYDIRPGNSMIECTNGCPGNEDPKACEAFCDCIYGSGKSLDVCLDEYQRAKK